MPTLVKEIAEKVKSADESTINAILEMLVELKGEAVSKRSEYGCELPEYLEEAGKFEGKNPTLSEYEKLSLQQQCELQDADTKRNKSWIRKKFAELNATWLFVINGNVIAYGSDLSSYPEDDFIDSIFADVKFLPAAQVVEARRTQVFLYAFHFNRRYIYLPKRVTIALRDISGVIRESRQTINCILDWQQSPFTQINPNRTGLIGRKVLLELKPKVLLDFSRNVTNLHF